MFILLLIKIDLMKTANLKYKTPFRKKLFFRIIAKRNHPRNFKTVESSRAQIQVVLHPWFKYLSEETPNIKVIFPLNWKGSRNNFL